MRDVYVDFAAGFKVCDFEFGGFVVAFGPPGDVVGVAEGVDVEDVDVGRGQQEVLEKLWTINQTPEGKIRLGRTYRSEQMPWVKKQERNDKPHDVSGCQRHDEREEQRIMKKV